MQRSVVEPSQRLATPADRDAREYPEPGHGAQQGAGGRCQAARGRPGAGEMSQPPLQRAGGGVAGGGGGATSAGGAALPGLLLPPSLLAALSPGPESALPVPTPAQAWNHLQILSELQVPNYYGRQPQVAHMSSERPLSHSPLTWHTPTPSPSEHQHHQQLPKGASNLYRHTPPPPEVQLLKCAPNPALFRHTPTPPDKSYRHTPTPPDVQSLKGSNPLYRHTPTPPDAAHGIKGGVSVFRHTPPPDGQKGPSNPLFNLQQMISDSRGIPPRDILSRPESYSRLSPGLTHGSMDLSVTRSPRNGSQNGETSAPISLSVRDASKINSLDSTEITKIQQVPVNYVGKSSLEITKSSSPTPVNCPRSPKSSKRSSKKVDSLLERLNSNNEGVMITPVAHGQSPHSVIVNAHSAEDNRSSALFHMNLPPYTTCEPVQPSLLCRLSPTVSVDRPSVSISVSSGPETINSVEESKPSHSVIIEEVAPPKDEPLALAANCSNEDSNESSSDGGRAKRRRKQLKTSKVESGDSNKVLEVDNFVPDTLVSKNVKIPDKLVTNESSTDKFLNRSEVASLESQSKEISINGLQTEQCKLEEQPIEISKPVTNDIKQTESESETIDNIAALIASTEAESSMSSDELLKSYPNPTDPPKTIENIKAVLESSVETSIANKMLQTENEQTTNDIKTSIEETKLEIKSDISITEENVTSENKLPQPNVKSESSFVEVENELEKMFAGIDESKNCEGSKSEVLDSTNVTEDTECEKIKVGKRGRRKKNLKGNSDNPDECGTPKKKRKYRRRSLNAEQSSIEQLELQNKKRGKPSKLVKDNLKKELCKSDFLNAYDSGSNASSSKSRGPYVQIKGPRDSPISVNVINTPMQDDDVDKPLQKIKSIKPKSSLNSDNDFRSKVKSRGLHSSTLSMKYDATTTDISWICVFCKRGPHTGGKAINRAQMENMGDLFGPYVISTNCPDYLSMINDPHDSLFKMRTKQDALAQSKQVKHGVRRQKSDSEIIVDNENKCKLPNEEMYQGMTDAGGDSYEIWLHEMCGLWAPGVYLVGAKIVGLDSAVWSCCTVKCDSCNLFGATIACIKHGCNKTMHVNCARSNNWTLSENDFMVYCTEHKSP